MIAVKFCRSLSNDMIMVPGNHPEINSSFQNGYQKTCNRFFAGTRKCPDCHDGKLYRHGSYLRSFESPVNGVRDEVLIQRAKCSVCGKTHALIPAELVPFSRVPLLAQFLIAVMAGLFKGPDRTLRQAECELARYALPPVVIRYISKHIAQYWSDFLSLFLDATLEELCLLAWKDRNKQLFQMSRYEIAQSFPPFHTAFMTHPVSSAMMTL
ncbi:DUF6431 domain-containing protein [Faecalibaculum rodentium]|uniref:DUF6431 domain-containing protein n=1 Tax=Faecalibaculum rodentium TaxID=1702221 RepID=UPI001C3E117C|nr:DUF6431 domain-containing protein [Faecalibaculum rodentium]